MTILSPTFSMHTEETSATTTNEFSSSASSLFLRADLDSNGNAFRTPSTIERQVLDLAKLNLGDHALVPLPPPVPPMAAPAPETPTVVKKRKPCCVTPPKNAPPEVCRERCIRAMEEQDPLRDFATSGSKSLRPRRTSASLACLQGNDDSPSRNTTNNSCKRFRRSKGIAGLAPMLPDSPEMETVDGNPFHRHRPQFSPVKGSTTVNIKFLESLVVDRQDDEQECGKSEFSVIGGRRLSYDMSTPFIFGVPDRSLPDLEVHSGDELAPTMLCKTLKMRPARPEQRISPWCSLHR